jgi:hypothetical protein
MLITSGKVGKLKLARALVSLLRDTKHDVAPNEAADHLCEAARYVSGERTARRFLALADAALEGFGVECIVDDPYGIPPRTVTLYVNTGDTYNTTFCYEPGLRKMRLTTWGDMVEAWEKKHGAVK